MDPEINSCAQIAEVLKYMKITQLKLVNRNASMSDKNAFLSGE